MSTVSTTSFTVPPSAVRTVFTSASVVRAQSQRRCGPIGPLSDDIGVGRTTPASARSPRPSSPSCPQPGAAPASRSAPRGTARTGSRRGRRARRTTSRTSLGSGSACQVSAHRRRGSRSESSTTVSEIGARHAVDHAVMHLRHERPMAVLEALDHPHLPQRLVPVELLRHDAARRGCAAPGRRPATASAVWRRW